MSPDIPSEMLRLCRLLLFQLFLLLLLPRARGLLPFPLLAFRGCDLHVRRLVISWLYVCGSARLWDRCRISGHRVLKLCRIWKLLQFSVLVFLFQVNFHVKQDVFVKHYTSDTNKLGTKLTLANSQNASWNSDLRVENIGTRKKLRVHYFNLNRSWSWSQRGFSKRQWKTESSASEHRLAVIPLSAHFEFFMLM